MKMKLFRGIVGFIVALSVANAYGTAKYEVPLAVKAPVIDGVEAMGEWDGALRIVGAGIPVDARHAEISLMWNSGHLYIKTKSESAPRNRLTTSTASFPGTAKIVMDDSVEFWFNPPKEVRTDDETKRFGFFQMIVNHKGDVYGRHHDPGYGLPARDWKLDAMVKDWTVSNDTWTLELAIPAQVFGIKTFVPMEISTLLVRNFRTQKPLQAPFIQPGGGFMDVENYPKMRLSREKTGQLVDRRPEDLAPFEWNTPEARIVADLETTGIANGKISGVKIPFPGAILLRTKTAGEMADKGYRRYFSTDYRSSGYFGFQEDMANGRTMLFFAHGFSGQKNLNKRLKCPADGREAVIAVNFEPKKVTYFLNGIKQGEMDVAQDLSVATLGDLKLGGGEEGLEFLDWTLYSRNLTEAEIKAFSQGNSPVSGTLSWYPYINSLVFDITVDSAKFSGRAPIWRVVKRGESEVVASGRVSLKGGFPMGGGDKELMLIRKSVPIGAELAEGEYVASIVAEGEEDILIETEFSVRKYEWFKNSLGKEDRLLPGFTPVEVEGSKLKCVGREYEIGANGFPLRVFADGKQILADEVALWGEKKGIVAKLGMQSVERGVPSQIISRKLSDTKAEYATIADGYSVKGFLEQDGLLRFTIDFNRVPDADRVWFEIPVKKEFAALFHACGEGLRANPGGFVPPGEGVVFRSRDIPQTHVSNFIPYCWIGTDTRGICYAADIDIGWMHSDNRDAVEIVRKADGTVSIVLNLLNNIADVQGCSPPKIELSLMASPVKPMPKGWRGWSDGFRYNGTLNARVLGSPPYWGNFTAWTGRYPAWGEFEYVRKLREAMDTGKADEVYIKDWINRVSNSTSPETEWVNKMAPDKRRAYVERHARAAFGVATSLHRTKNPILYFYTCDGTVASTLAEYAMFRHEWADCKVAIPSYADYALWYLDKMLDVGMQGVYDDNTFIFCNFNWATGEAKVDEKGVVHPSFGIWNSREYRRRQANILVTHGLFPWITVHHTNGNILPVLGYAANSMGMEWKYGASDFQTRFSPDYIRAVCQGLQGGFFPTAIAGITGLGGAEKKEERIRVTRTMMASLLVHEVRPTMQHGSESKTVIDIMDILMDFGIGKEDCTYTAYWNEGNPIACSDKDVLVSVYSRDGRFLAVCGSWADGDREIELSLKRGAIVSAKNAETCAPIPFSGGKLGFRLAKHDLAIVEIGTDACIK